MQRRPLEVFPGIVLVVCQGLAGCGASSPTPTTPSFLPYITALSVTTGSTGGGTPIRITGTGFENAVNEPGRSTTGTKVTFGGITVTARFDSRFQGTDIFFDTPAHTAGAVDVIVTNTGGQVHRLPGAFTYALPESFDFNGSWSGFANDGSEASIEFTIQNNVLIRASCDTLTLTFSPPPSVSGGEFYSFGSDGVGIWGRIVSSSHAVGASNIPPCSKGATWAASKQ